MTNFEIYTYLKSKNGGGGEPVPGPVTNPALRLMDWEGTVLKEYTAEQVASLSALPTPSSLNTNVDRELLTFQGYNWALSDIKSWVTAHEGQCLTVGAIYTTTDGQNYNFWNNPRLTTATTISRHKRGTTIIGSNAFYKCSSLTSINIPERVTGIGNSAFNSCYSLTSISLPEGVTNIGSSAFNSCSSLTSISLPEGVTSIGSNAFNYCRSLTDIVIKGTPSLADTSAFSNIYSDYLIYVPKDYLSFYSSATNWTQLYDQGKIVAIEDYINYLKSIGIDVREFEGE